MGQLSSSVGSRSAFVALAATRLRVPIQVPRRIFSSAALAMKAERVSPCAAAGGFASLASKTYTLWKVFLDLILLAR